METSIQSVKIYKESLEYIFNQTYLTSTTWKQFVH